MLIAVIDTETTGAEEIDQVCELAVIQISSEIRVMPKTRDTLIRPTCSVSPVARAVHHITDEELRSAPTIDDLMTTWKRRSPLIMMEEADCIAGHYVDFDLRMLAQSGFAIVKPTICTWRCARHLWPDAPAYGNQVLRYWLDLNVPSCLGLQPHRAITDAFVTTALLYRMLEDKSATELVHLTQSPVLMTKVGFGQYKGMTWREVRLRDRGYLSWMIRQSKFGADEKHTAQHWLKKKREECHDGSEILQVCAQQTPDLSAETEGTPS